MICQREIFTKYTAKPMWRFCTRRLFLLSGFCMRDTRMFFSPLVSEFSPTTLIRYCGFVQKVSGGHRGKNMFYLHESKIKNLCSAEHLKHLYSSIYYIMTSVIYAASSSSSSNPPTLVHRGLPLSRGFSIYEVWFQATDVKICVELTEIFKCHPVNKIR